MASVPCHGPGGEGGPGIDSASGSESAQPQPPHADPAASPRRMQPSPVRGHGGRVCSLVGQRRGKQVPCSEEAVRRA